MQQPVLVPLDGSDFAQQALPYAQIFSEPGCQLILLEVGQDEDDLGLLERHAGSCASLETAVGDPVEQILRVARDLHVGLIVMTTHGRGAMGRWIFGSVADRVARSTPVPVLLLRPSESESRPVAIRRLVVPLDGSTLAEEALPTAEALARRLGVPIHLITVIDIIRIIPVEVGPVVAFNAAVYEEILAQLDSGAAALLARVSEQLDREGLLTSSKVVHGSPFSGIADAVQDADLIVMTSHGRGGVRRWLLGSVAEKLVREAPVPIILVPVAARQAAMSTEIGFAG